MHNKQTRERESIICDMESRLLFKMNLQKKRRHLGRQGSSAFEVYIVFLND